MKQHNDNPLRSRKLLNALKIIVEDMTRRYQMGEYGLANLYHCYGRVAAYIWKLTAAYYHRNELEDALDRLDKGIARQPVQCVVSDKDMKAEIEKVFDWLGIGIWKECNVNERLLTYIFSDEILIEFDDIEVEGFPLPD